MALMVWGLAFRAHGSKALGFRFESLWFNGFGVEGLGFRVMVQGLGMARLIPKHYTINPPGSER